MNDSPGKPTAFTGKLSRMAIIALEDIKYFVNNPTYTGGDMKIRFDRYESTKTNPNASGKTFPIYRIYGTALEGKLEGQEWTTQIFVSAKDMVSQVKSLTKGDTVNVKMKKNGNYWNATSFDKEESAPSVPTTGASQAQHVPVATSPRFANLELAISVLGPKGKKNAADYLMEAGSVADMIQDYVDEKGAFQFDKETSDGIPEVGDEDNN